ncbi:MAG TPA: DUF4416 family protein, partial [Sedimentisphaerales bacterium]|nr:DUF4416 family protein [Sedimentisphaerales bacterium]
GEADFTSDVWQFCQTDYYRDETGEAILRQFVTFDRLINPGDLAAIKHRTNAIEQRLAGELDAAVPRPVNLDPGYIEPSKLVLASTKNFSHRIYIGSKMWAEVTLIYSSGWTVLPWTFPDYRLGRYHEFFDKVRTHLVEQLREKH